MKNADRHPLSHHNQVELSVVVMIEPRGRRDHPRFREPFRPLGGDIHEPSCAVVLEQVAPGRTAVLAGNHPAADEEVEIAVSVEVSRNDAGAVLEEVGQAVHGTVEVALTVAQVEPVPERFVVTPVLVSSADDVQVRMSVAVGIEEGGRDVFVEAVRLENPVVARAEPAIGLLQEQPPRLVLGAADKEVVQAVAVHVTGGEGGSFGREQVRHERLAVVVEEPVLLVRELDVGLGRHIDEEPRVGCHGRRSACRHRCMLLRIHIPPFGVAL